MAPLTRSKKSKTTSYRNTDSSSLVDLPDELIENIISYFPIKDATRAALLSKRFTNSCKLCRNFCFDVNRKNIAKGTFANVVDRILDQHSGPKIEKAVIFYPTGQENRVNDWIRKVVDKGVEELDLDFSEGYRAFTITSDLIDVQSIRVLRLRYCKLRFAMQLNGLRFLRRLSLQQVRVTSKFTDTILSNCLLLESLEFVSCIFDLHVQIFAGHLKQFKSLKLDGFQDVISIFVNAPTLETLRYNGEICSFTFNGYLSFLNVVAFNFKASRTFQQLDGVEELILSLSFSRELTICSTILEGLSPKFKDFEYTEFQFCLWNLKALSLFFGGSSNVRGTTFVNPCDIIYFLKKCPLLEKLYIDLGDYSFEEGLYWKLIAKERFEQCNPFFHFLKDVRMRGFKNHDLEFELLKIMVKNAPSLDMVTLIMDKTSKPTSEGKRFLSWMMKQKCSFEVYQYENSRRSSLCSKRFSN